VLQPQKHAASWVFVAVAAAAKGDAM